MGTLVFGFLSGSVLFDDRSIASGYRRLSEAELGAELARYRQFLVDHLAALKDEIGASPGSLRCYGGVDFATPARLVQAAFYLDQVVLPDPLFPFTHRPEPAQRAMTDALGVAGDGRIDRTRLAQAAGEMKSLAPLVAADYVKFFPTTYFLERTMVPLLAPGPDLHAKEMRVEVLKHYHEHAQVRSAFPIPGSIAVGTTLEPGRLISVLFGDDPAGFMFRLSQDTMNVIDADQGLVRLTLPALGTPEPPVEEEVFRTWVQQSVNEAALFNFRDLCTQQAIVAELGLAHLTGSQFTAGLLGLNAPDPDIPTVTANAFLNLELPFFAEVDAATVMRVRRDDGEAFQAFRRELEKGLRELRLETDPVKRRLKADNVMHELTEVQLGAVAQKARKLKQGVMAEAILATAAMVPGLTYAPALAMFVAGVRSYKAWRDYQDKVVLNPTYFLWKVKSG